MKNQRTLLAFAALVALALPAQAADVALVANGTWNEFDIDNQLAPSFDTRWIDNVDGSPARFLFTIDAGYVGTLKVVDAGFAGDVFQVTNGGVALGQTSAVPVGPASGTPVFDFDAAIADSSFSRGVFTLGAGAYSISGSLLQSTLDASGAPLNATIGAVSLTTVLAVPEPSSYALIAAGLGVVGLFRRRRAASN